LRNKEAAKLKVRSTAEVFREHLELRQAGQVDAVIERNYAHDVVLLTTYGIFRTRDGVREGAKLLKQQLGDAKFTYITQYVQDDIAFLEWTARSNQVIVHDGADTFLIRDGQIIIKTVHYTVKNCEEARQHKEK
jgi:hypothetical protein